MRSSKRPQGRGPAFAVDVLLPVQGEGQAVVLAQALAELHPGAVGPVVVLAATALAGLQVGATVVLLQGVLEGVAVEARTQRVRSPSWVLELKYRPSLFQSGQRQ